MTLRLKTPPKSRDGHGMIVSFQVARSPLSQCQALSSLPLSRVTGNSTVPQNVL